MILSTENKITSDSELTTPDNITGFGKENMLVKDLSLQFRFAPSLSDDIVFSPAASLTFYSIAILGTNIRESATVEVDYGSGAVPMEWFNGKLVYYIPAGVTGSADVTITIEDANHPDGYIKIGYLLFGNRVLYPDPIAGSLPETEDTSSVFESQTLQVVGEEGQLVRAQEIACAFITKDEFNVGLSTWKAMKKFNQFLFFHTEQNLSLNEPLWVRFTEFNNSNRNLGRKVPIQGDSEFSFSFIIKEVF